MLTATVHGPTHSTARLHFSRDGNAEASSSRRRPPAPPPSWSFTPTPQSEYPLSAIGRDAPDELTWSGSTVVWTKGVRAFRKYTYGDDDEPVSCALFATFRSSDVLAGAVAGGASGTATATGSDTFGPFHTPTLAKWGAARVHLAARSRERERERELEDAVVVFLQTRAHVYTSGGSGYVVHLPFVVRAAWAMEEGGVMVQRALSRREVAERRGGIGRSVLRGMGGAGAGGDQTFLSEMRDVDFEEEALGTVWTLEHPLEVFKPVVRASLVGGKIVDADDIGVEMEVVDVLEGPGMVVLRRHDTGRVLFAQRKVVAQGEPCRRDLSPEELLNGPEHGRSRPRASLRPLARARDRELQDATMMLGLDNVEGERSEVVLEVVAEWEVPE